MIKAIQQVTQRIFERWLARRMPAMTSQTLSQRTVFIFPSPFGFAYLLFDLLLFLLATNYQNNVILLLSFILVSIFITTMLQSFHNLSGLTIRCVKQNKTDYHGFANSAISLLFELSSTHLRSNLVLGVAEQNLTSIPQVNLGQQVVAITYKSEQRGQFNLPRIILSSRYPLGLFTTWTRLDFGLRVTVFPQPKPVALVHASQLNADINDDGALTSNIHQGHEDFYQLAAYQQGEPLSRVAWKQYAKGQGLWSKQLSDTNGSIPMLTLLHMPAPQLERKLSYLTYLILAHHHADSVYGIDIFGQKIAPSSGEMHLIACLTACALTAKTA